METEGFVGASSWASLTRDVLERIGCELSLRDVLAARSVCRQWRQHVTGAVRHLPHAHQAQQRQLVELDAQPSGAEAVWQQSLAALATCLPHLSEIMVYVSSRVPEEQLGAQLRSLPVALPGLTKLELRYIVPSSVPCLGTSLQQLQPSLTALTGLGTLYLIMGASPEPAEVTAVLPALSRLRDLKLLSGLPQYGFTNAKLQALGCATQLQRLHLEVSGVGQVDAGLGALSRLRSLRQLWLDGLVTLGPAVVAALQQLPELQELRLELDSPQHIPDLFALSDLKRLSLTYHGDELDHADEVPPPAPPDGAVDNNNNNNNNGPGAGPGGTDWDALERLVRGHAERPVLCELGLLCCSFPADPLPRLALLTSLTSLTFYDCRWKAAPPPPRPNVAVAAAAVAATAAPCHEPLPASSPGAAATAATPRAPESWGVLTSLVGLQGFGMAQCVVPPISEFDLASLAAAWPGITSLQLQSPVYRVSELPLLSLRPQPARVGAFLARWRRLEALTLSGSWCNDPRVALDVSLLPASLTSLIVSSGTLINSAAAKGAILESVARREGALRRLEDAPTPSAATAGGFGADAAGSGAVRHAAGPHSGPAQGFCIITAGGKAEPQAEGFSERATESTSGPGYGAPLQPPPPPTGATPACGGESHAGAGNGGADAHVSALAPSGSDCVSEQPCGTGTSSSGSGEHGLGCGRCSPAACNPAPAAASAGAAAAAAPAPPAPDLSCLEHLVLGEVRLGAGVSLEALVAWAPNLRSLEINNLIPNLTDDSVAVLSALTALTVLRVSQDQDPEGAEPRGGPCLMAAATAGDGTGGGGQQPQPRPGPLSGMGLSALTGLRNLRQLEFLPWGMEPLELEHVGALAHLRRLHLVTLRGARDGAISERALEALRERLPLCDIDDTEWSGLVDV